MPFIDKLLTPYKNKLNLKKIFDNTKNSRL